MKKKREKGPPKILVIDDEINLLWIFQRMLEDEGYKVLTAKDGFEGIEKNKKDNPDLIILDLKMPEMDGIETLRKIRKTDKDVIVVILTGYGSAETAREAADLDVYEYISKPPKSELVERVIKEALSSKSK